MIIYKIINLVNNKIYIGLTTKTLEQRWKNYLKCYKQTGYAIHKTLIKYGLAQLRLRLTSRLWL